MKYYVLVLSLFLAVVYNARGYTDAEKKIMSKVPSSMMSTMKKQVKKYDKAERPAKLLQTATAYVAIMEYKKDPAFDKNIKKFLKWLEKRNNDKGNYFFIHRNFKSFFEEYVKADKFIETYKKDRIKYKKLQLRRVSVMEQYMEYADGGGDAVNLGELGEWFSVAIHRYTSTKDFTDDRIRVTKSGVRRRR